LCHVPTRSTLSICGRLRKNKRECEMARNFRELEAKMSPESRARSDAKTKKMIAEMALDELREARELTQQHLANLLGINQAAVSKMERRADMYISTLQSMIRAMGGQLKIVASPRAGWRSINSASSRKPPERIEGTPHSSQSTA